jgi:LDH2 family malate/lactate/ureidoglycolate dehydrogenase
MIVFQAADLERVSQSILAAAGTPADLAAVVATSLVDADLAGHPSHGVIRLTSYMANVRSGQVQPAARATVERLGGGCARVDGAWGWGQPAARLATATASELAGEQGVALVTIARCNHIGRLGEYVEMLTRAGRMAFMTCNARPAVAPFGGFTRLLGTNPVAWGTPRRDGRPPLVVDFAKAAIAEGKLKVAHAAGKKAPAGAVLDRDGRPTEETAVFYDGGALTTFGGHKGFGLSVMAEVLGGIMSGTGASAAANFEGGNGTAILAVDATRFVAADEFEAQVEAFAEQLQAAPRAPGFDEILLPGEPEWRSRRARQGDGIPVSDGVRAAINELAAELGVGGL